MAGLWMTSSSSHLMTSHQLTSDALVCHTQLPIGNHGLYISLSRTKTGKLIVSLAKKSLVPKFQGENFYKNKAIVDLIRKLATRKGCSVAQIALAWVAAQGLISIPGTTRASRLEENWASRNVELTADELNEMRQIVDAAKPVGERFNEFFQAMVGH